MYHELTQPSCDCKNDAISKQQQKQKTKIKLNIGACQNLEKKNQKITERKSTTQVKQRIKQIERNQI